MAGKRSAFSTYNTLRKDRDPGVQSVYAEFARRLQAKMQERGWNQSELARRCTQMMPKAARGQKQNRDDFGRDRISHYVRGISMPRPESLTIIAKALGCDEMDLLPPMAVPSAGAPPPFEISSVGGDRVALRINRTVTMMTATKIIALLTEEDAA